MGNINRKATREEMGYASQVIREAFPEYEPIFGSHSYFGGHRAPRDHTIAFRLRDSAGRFRSNVVWLIPEELANLNVEYVRKIVALSNGTKRNRRS